MLYYRRMGRKVGRKSSQWENIAKINLYQQA